MNLEMLAVANNLEFEKAALLRDQIRELKRAIDGSRSAKEAQFAKPTGYRKGVKSRKAGLKRTPL